jgi:hypothetical protein
MTEKYSNFFFEKEKKGSVTHLLPFSQKSIFGEKNN